MRLWRFLLTALVAVALLLVPAFGAQGASGSGKGGGSGTGQGGGGTGGGGGGGSTTKGSSYSDLWVIARYTNGTPITTSFTVGGETSICVQPITFDAGSGFPALTGPDVYPYDKTAHLIPLVGDSDPALEPCDVTAAGLPYVSEVDLGRLNLGRSPERVLAQQLEEVITALKNATAITLDASGRLVTDGVAIDSPLANLAIYQSILETGKIGELAVPAVALDDMELAAAALAAASPKEDFTITVDLVQYLNRILNIPADAETSGYATAIKGENGEKFYNYNYPAFSYDRSAMFPGWVKYLEFDPASATEPMVCVPVWTKPISAVVFQGEAALSASGIDGFVTFAEDARDVLVWVHDTGALVIAVDLITEAKLAPSTP